MIKHIVIISFALLCISSLSVRAQTPSVEKLEDINKNINDAKTVEDTIKHRIQNSDDRNYLSLSFENDLIGGGSDENYTNGVRLTYFDIETPMPPIIDELADAVPTFDINQTTSTFFTIGQSLFTPQDIKIAANQPNDRPWAAYLYGSVGLATVTKNHLDELEFTAGVVGPLALGEQTQKFIHNRISDSPIPKGWDNQIKNEPALNGT